MAVRLMNLHRHPLRVDLRGGGVVVVQPGQRSAPLREELLYDNHHLPEWERAGWVARVPIRMQEVLDAEAPPKAKPARKARAAKKGKAKGVKRAKRATRAKTAKRATKARAARKRKS